MRLAIIVTGGLGFLLAGCATTSFAPPEVALTPPDTKNLDAAIGQIDTLITAYRKANRETSDSRQVFEMPAFFATLGAVTASAFGAGTDVAIAGATGNTIFNAGKAYYAPKAKAQMYDSALSALYCIQQVALGVKPFAHSAAPADLRSYGMLFVGDDSAFYYLVRNAGLSVERVLTNRLSNAGSLTDAEALTAELQKKIKEVEEARKKQPAAAGYVAAASIPDTATVLKTMQADLELCVSRAKL